MANLVMTDMQKVSLTVEFKDAAGNPASVDGVPVWASSDPSVTVVAATDGLSAVATAAGPLGTAQISVTLGSLTGTLDIQIVASAAVSVAIVAGTPEAK